MKSFQKRYLILFLIAAFLASGIGFYSYYRYQQARVQTEWIHHTNIVLQDINQFRVLYYKAQTEQRNYILYRKPEYIDRFNQSRDRANDLLRDLAELTTDSPAQGAIINDIQSDFQEFVASAEAQIYRIGAGPTDRLAAMDDLQSMEGGLQKQVDLFIKNEGIFLQSRLDSLGKLNRKFYLAIISGALASLFILMVMNYYLFLARSDTAAVELRLQELKEKQAQSIQATKDGIFEWNLPEQNLYWSPRVKEMIGYEDEELDATAENLERLMHPDDRENFWQQLHKHLRGEVPEHSTYFRWHHKDGYWVWINSRGRAVFNEFGEATKLLGVYTDVTRLKEYELQLARSKDEAEKANNAKSDFLAHMSHEIRTPLTAITGVAEILSQQKNKFDEKTLKLLGALNASAISLRDLINDILDFSKIESGKVVLEEKDINLSEFFENIMSLSSIKAQEKGLRFECNFSHVAGMHILGDRTRMRQILINLIGNAMKFTQKGSVVVKATTQLSNKQELLEISVIDTGIGIAEEQLPNIFDSFKQADASISRKYGGTGLGLPIAKHLAQLMDGNIYVSSKAGEGSTFTFNLPIVKAPEIAHEEVDPAPVRVASDINIGEDERILIVEDYDGNIAFITHILDDLRLKYDLAKTGLEGLKLWSDNPYRLVLMDIQMPEMDGISAVRHIRTIEREREMKHTPIIAMTAHAFSEDRNKCLEAGFDDYMAKPLSRQVLIEKMSDLTAA